MTTKEFQAWLDGYMDGKDCATKKQWEKIKQKAAELNEPVVIVNPPYISYQWVYPRYWETSPTTAEPLKITWGTTTNTNVTDSFQVGLYTQTQTVM